MNIHDKDHPFWKLVQYNRNSYAKSGEFFEVFGSICFFIGGIMFMGNRAGGVVREMHFEVYTYWSISITLIIFGAISNRFGKKIAQPSAKDILQKDCRKPIIYLRTFDADSTTSEFGTSIRIESLETEEEAIVKALNEIGPVIAIGRPKEILPSIGASRFYVTDNNWKAAIDILTNESNLVIIRLGSSCGLLWELKHTSELFYQGKLQVIFIVPNFLDNEIIEFLAMTYGLKRIFEDFESSYQFRSIKGLILLQNNREPFYQTLKYEFNISQLIDEIKNQKTNNQYKVVY
jgi:hypothetical protein